VQAPDALAGAKMGPFDAYRDEAGLSRFHAKPMAGLHPISPERVVVYVCFTMPDTPTSEPGKTANPASGPARNNARDSSPTGTEAPAPSLAKTYLWPIVLGALSAVLLVIIAVYGVRVGALNETILQDKTRADQQGAAATLLQSQVDETKADSAKLQAQIDNAKARTLQLNGLVDKTKAGAAELQTELDQSRAISNGFQSQMEDAKVVSIRHQGEVEVAKAQVTVMQSQVNEARTDIARLQEQVASSRDESAALQTKLDAAESEIARMKKVH
jgi:hypothetical protein